MSTAAERLDLGAIAQRLASARIGARERRRFRRMPIAVGGRMLDQLGREHDCRTADISPGDVRIAAPILPNVGERVVIYLDGLGRMSGKVARRCGEGEVAIIFDFSAHKREKLAEQLTLLVNRDLAGEIADESVRPAERARISLENGESYDGEVLDFSLTGATLRTHRPAPPLGAWVRIGAIYGRVGRLIENGFAVDFEPRRQP